MRLGFPFVVVVFLPLKNNRYQSLPLFYNYMFPSQKDAAAKRDGLMFFFPPYLGGFIHIYVCWVEYHRSLFIFSSFFSLVRIGGYIWRGEFFSF